MSPHHDHDAGTTSPRRGTASATPFIRDVERSQDRVRKPTRGFTLLELMLVMALIGILAAIASSQYSGYIDRLNVGAAKADILEISLRIERFRTMNFALPASLADIGQGQHLDPWGNPYHYTLLNGGNKGKARKDRRLNPLNSDFDLFSAGKNGVFKSQITQKDSVDDVIRARNGSFVDLASEF